VSHSDVFGGKLHQSISINFSVSHATRCIADWQSTGSRRHGRLTARRTEFRESPRTVKRARHPCASGLGWPHNTQPRRSKLAWRETIMKPRPAPAERGDTSLLDLFVIFIAVAMMVVLFLPMLAKSTAKACRIN
jgi:hypothetical protein